MALANIYAKIGAEIRKARVSAKMTQTDLARNLGYNTPQFVSLFERGLSKIPTKTIGEISRFLRIPERQMVRWLIQDFEKSLEQDIKAGKGNPSSNPRKR